MDPWSKVELLTHHPGGGHGDEEASGMVFFLRQGAGTGTTISSRDQNRDEHIRIRKAERRWQAAVVLQTINEGEVVLSLEGTGART